MMKTLFVAVAVLSLTSMCQPAPLTCDKLLKPVDKSPDLSGRWYIIAVSTNVGVIPALINVFFRPSTVVDIAPKDTPKHYEAKVTTKMYEYCDSESESFIFENNTMLDPENNNRSHADALLQTSCPDCIVIKGQDIFYNYRLLSRRKQVRVDELKEFEAQADCLDWSKPQVLNTDHDYENCKSLDGDSDFDTSTLSKILYQKLRDSYMESLSCVTKIVSQPNAIFKSVQYAWSIFGKSLQS